MEFLVGQDGNVYENSIHVLIQDDAETVLNIRLPGEENTVDGWRARFIYLYNTNPDALNDLLSAIPQLLAAEVDEEAHSTYLLMLYALLKWVEGLLEQTSTHYDFQTLRRLYEQLDRALFDFKVDGPHNGFYKAIFSHPTEEPLEIEIPSDKFDKSPMPVSQVVLTLACERRPEPIEHFIDDFVYFQNCVVKDDSKTFQVFICLSKALIRLIKQESVRLGMYISRVPDICTFIVKNEQDTDEQKKYLEPILSSLEHVEQRLERLDEIIEDIEHEITRKQNEQQTVSKQQKEDGRSRLMQVISVISNHYLTIYDLNHSASFWKKAKFKDPLLRLFLTFHRRPLFFLLGQFLLLSIPSVYAYRQWASRKAGPLAVPASNPIFFFILIWYLILVALVVAVLWEIFRKRWLYSQLLLPRILGATIVGLLPLLLYDQSWLISIQKHPINWLLVVLFTYAGSFSYILIDVYNILKFVPGRSMTEVLKVSGHIFCIAFSETLFIVTITSTLILAAILSSSPPTIGISISLGPWLSFGFFPFFIPLWTGFTLFIGAFVQLMWQGGRITEPI